MKPTRHRDQFASSLIVILQYKVHTALSTSQYGTELTLNIVTVFSLRKHIKQKMARVGRPSLSLIHTGLLLAVVLLPGENLIYKFELKRIYLWLYLSFFTTITLGNEYKCTLMWWQFLLTFMNGTYWLIKILKTPRNTKRTENCVQSWIRLRIMRSCSQLFFRDKLYLVAF